MLQKMRKSKSRAPRRAYQNNPRKLLALLAASINVGFFSVAVQADAAIDAGLEAGTTASAAIGNKKIDSVSVIGQHLDEARNGLAPETGSSIYRFDSDDLQALPLGSATPLNQVVLQAPGVVQDSYGQLHIRGDHANVQYRINEVVIPEPIAGFGQSLDTRFADQINLLTGALPAQYGYRTAGVVDIHTKSSYDNGGDIGYIGGSHNHRELNLDAHGAQEGFNYFLTGSYLRSDLGIENPTAERNAVHDATKQGKGFGYFSYIVDPDSRLSLILGSSNSHFDIPNRPGLAPSFNLDNTAPLASRDLDAQQNEKNIFQIVSYQTSIGENSTYLLSLFHRYTDVHYRPDAIGDLQFNGIAAQILRKNDTFGTQADASFKLNDWHTLRAGIYLSQENFRANNDALVFPATADGLQSSAVPLAIQDKTQLDGKLYGVYLQDEWQALRDLTINYGVRFDRTTTVVDEQQFSPRIGLIYDLTEQTKLHAGYSRYFTPPPTETIDTTAVQKFLGTTNALPSDANTSVKSERSNYFDIGLSQQLTSTIALGVDAYYRQVKNLQDEGQFGKALVYSAFNFDEGRIRGLELSSSYHNDNLSAYANIAVSKAEGRNIVSGQFNFDTAELAYIGNHWVHLDHDQTVSGSAGLNYRWGDTTYGADLLYGSGLRKSFANTAHLPAYTQVNFSASQTFKLGPIGAIDTRIALLNVFDRSYQLRDGSGIGVGAPQFGPRRELYFGISKPF